ncbi:hypothetical protein EXIGLDRAFT_734841 [Exidia glandulosa HHB12029]|uniref:Haloacid dehalogenase-like hydrolase domain-containing protein 2 n=1 Tax=Exidia glandulosa HHB12029 TaxID=1314781 RepID=A0A165AYX0_EXIGL|nr:hypothetical protein EXIGLDRAFT_734841 [Exidia glandulosa HHB12029]
MPAAYRALLLDLSGTLHVGSRPIPRGVESLAKLRAAGVPFRICSNTSKDGARALAQKLQEMGYEIREHEMFTSLQACKAELTARNLKRPLLLLSDSALDDFREFSQNAGHDGKHDAVVLGLAPSRFDYAHLDHAFRVLIEADGQAPLLATHRARYIRTEDGGLSLGPGGFVSALETASGLQAHVIGKPSRSFFELALSSLASDGISREEWGQVAVVGDDVEADLGEGAVDLGLTRILVRTGKYREGDESRATGSIVLRESFSAVVDEMLGAGET